MDSIDVMSGRYEGIGRWFQADGLYIAWQELCGGSSEMQLIFEQIRTGR